MGLEHCTPLILPLRQVDLCVWGYTEKPWLEVKEKTKKQKTHTHTTPQWNCSPEIKTASAVLNKVKLGSTVLEAGFPGQNLNRQWAIQSKLPNCRGKIHLFEWRPQIGGQTLLPLLVIQHITTGKRQRTLKGASSETKLMKSFTAPPHPQPKSSASPKPLPLLLYGRKLPITFLQPSIGLGGRLE